MNVVSDPCMERSSPCQQLCVKHCAQDTDVLKLALDLPIFAPIILPSIVPMFTMADMVGLIASEQTTVSTGPPPYLRFLRLLN